VRASFAALAAEGALTLSDRGGEPVLALPAAALFRAESSSDLQPQGRALIARVIGVLARAPGWTLQVVGAPPTQPPGRFEADGWKRATTRTLSVARALAASGLPPERLTSLQVGDAARTAAPAFELRLAPPATPEPRRGL
jgi:flagellar motor protein MotB